MRKLGNSGQSEMVGFVLIVVLVVIALMVFLVISIRQDEDVRDSLEVDNMLEVVLDYTTDCAIVFEPNYDSVEDLIKSCYDNELCSNLDKSACNYLNETMNGLMNDLMASEAAFSAYELKIFPTEVPSEEIFSKFEGNCTGEASGAQKIILAGRDSLTVRLRVCS